MGSTSSTIQVENARELRKAIRQTRNEGMKAALKQANKDAAEIVAKEAKTEVPVLSGALRRTIRALGSQTRGQVAAGRGKVNRYAAIQHFGNPKHNIEPTPYLYDAQDKRVDEVRRAYERSLDDIVSRLSS